MKIKPSNPKLAILHQALASPPFDGARKPMKDGGYADSGADIAYTLKKSGLDIITPVAQPDASIAIDWVFGDTNLEINNAIRKGANCLWLNTQLHRHHSILDFCYTDVNVVGQHPETVHQYDNKYLANKYLQHQGLPVQGSVLIDLDVGLQKYSDVCFPTVIKPVRGRGSQGVELIENETKLRTIIGNIDRSKFGKHFMIEPFLPGKEITITVLPAGRYKTDEGPKVFLTPWCLPPVMRQGSGEGIAPYSGKVPVSRNSVALNRNSLSEREWQPLLNHCSKVGELLHIRAPIRIDCRQDELGDYKMFDINFKPNMTGMGRPGRDMQDGLTTLAARSFGWSYLDLLGNLLQQKWPLKDLSGPEI